MYSLTQTIISEGLANAAQIDAWFAGKNPAAPPVGAAIMAAHARSGINQDFLAAEADDETDHLTSKIFVDKRNVSGFGADDQDPYGHATTFASYDDSFLATAAHWLTYILGTNNPLAHDDPRYAVTLTTGRAGTVRTVRQIGNGVWATATDYNTSVLTRMNDLLTSLIPEPAPPVNITIQDIRDQLATNPSGGPHQTQSPKVGIVIHYNGPAVDPARRSGIAQLVIDAQYHVSKDWSVGAPHPAVGIPIEEDWRGAPPEAVGLVGGALYGDGIMYHYAVDADGVIYQLRDPEAVLWHCGSWVPGGNGSGWAIQVLLGDGQQATEKQLAGLSDLVETLRGWASIPLAMVKGHQELSPTACPGSLMDDFIRPYRAGTFVRPGTVVPAPVPAPIPVPAPPAVDPTNPIPLPPDAPQDDPVATLEAKIVEIAVAAIGQTMMGQGQMIDDGQPAPYVVHSPAGWCEAFAETVAQLATGERVRFASAESHYQHALANHYLMGGAIAAGGLVFYHFADDDPGHITVMVDAANTVGTSIIPDAIVLLPLHHYPGYAGWAHAEAVIDAAKHLPPADPTGGGLGRRDADGNRVFVWMIDPDTGKAVGLGGGFRDLWEGTGGPNNALIRYGLPLINERDASNDHGIPMVVQWLERARFEYHKNDGRIYRGLVGKEWKGLMERQGVTLPGPVSPVTDYVDDAFASYYKEHGGLEQFGFPLTALGPLPKNADGQFDGQLFERAVLERHPADAGAGWGVQIRLIGRELLTAYRAGKMTISG